MEFGLLEGKKMDELLANQLRLVKIPGLQAQSPDGVRLGTTKFDPPRRGALGASIVDGCHVDKKKCADLPSRFRGGSGLRKVVRAQNRPRFWAHIAFSNVPETNLDKRKSPVSR